MPDPTLYFYFLPAVKVHLVQNTSSLDQFCFHLSVLCFDVSCLIIEEQDTNTGVNLQKKIHTMTDKCKYSVFTKPSYKWFIFVTKILLASSATTFAHRRTSSSNTYWLIQAKSRLNVHTATFLVQASKLKTHKLTHSGEEPFICIQCNFSCTQADNLKRHMKTHTGEKTHKCAQCDYSFIHCQKLENHMRTHTGDVWSMCSFLCSVSRSESTEIVVYFFRFSLNLDKGAWPRKISKPAF